MIPVQQPLLVTQRPGRLCMVLMVATMLSPSIAAAAESVLPAGSTLDAGNFVSVLISLGVVLALIMAVAWIMKRTQRVRRGNSTTLEVVDVLPIGPKERILLIRAGENQLLVGMTPGRINTLSELTKPVTTHDSKPEFRIAEHAA